MKKNKSGSTNRKDEDSPARLIDAKISELDDWRGKMLDRVRTIIKQAAPEVVEEWKWRGVPVWEHDGIICTGETYKSVVKLTFAKGASLEDPAGLFNSSLEGNTRRAIDIREGEKIDARELKALIRAAVALNASKKSAKRATKASSKKGTVRKAPAKKAASKPVLLSGGNPQIAKADGDAPVQEYIAAMPGWKSDAGRRLDALIESSVPNVKKAVRWNTPFYGIEGQGWFLGFHCLTKYIKIAFFKGTSISPQPPVESKQKDVRYFHIHVGDQLDEELVASWIRQASQLPGEKMF